MALDMPSSAHVARRLAAIVGRANVRLEPARPAGDGAPPDVVVRPADANETADIVRYANAARVPVFPTSGGGVAPVRGGILLDLRRMDGLGDVDEPNLLVSVQPGVPLDRLRRALASAGFLCPLDPVGAASGSVGGVVARAGEGPGLGLYGQPRDHVAGVEAVLGNGDILRARVPGAAGQSLARLLVGTRGALGVYTLVTLRLRPAPEAKAAMLASFPSVAPAAQAAAVCLERRLAPAALAVLGGAACAAVGRRSAVGLLAAEVHAARGTVSVAATALHQALREQGAVVEARVEAPQDRDALWSPLRTIGAVLDGVAPRRQELIARLLPNRIAEFLRRVERTHRPGVLTAVLARPDLGEVRIVLLHHDAPGAAHAAETLADELAAVAIEMGGAAMRADGAPRSAANLASVEMKLLRQFKEVFDPNGILNPGAWLPGETRDGLDA